MTPESQIKRYTVPEFASRIRAKYPDAYKDLSDEDLTDRVLKKHPEYKGKVSFETRARSQPIAEAEAARLGSQAQAAANAYVSAGGKGLNPDVTPGTDYFRPLTTTEKAARRRGEPIIISEDQSQMAPTAPETPSRPRRATAPPVSMAPVVQGRLEQIQREKRQREMQAKVEQARQVRERGLVLPKGQRNKGVGYQPKFGLGQTYREVPKVDKAVPNVAEMLTQAGRERPLTFEEDRAIRADTKREMGRLEGRAGAAADFAGEEYQNFLRLNRTTDSPRRREEFLTLKAKQRVAEHGSIAGAILAEDEEAARRQRVAQMGNLEYAAQLPKGPLLGVASGAGTALKGLAVASRKIVDQITDTKGFDTRDAYVYQLGEAIEKNSRALLRSNPDLEKEFFVGKAPEALGQSALFLLGGWASKSPKLAISILGGTMTAGDAYEEVRALGGTDEEAVNAGLLAGAILGPTELIGTRGLVKALEGTVQASALKTALKQALVTGSKEGLENAVQEVGQDAGQGLITGNPRSLAELAEAGALGGIAGLVGTGTTTLGAAGIDALRNRGQNIVADYLEASPLSTPEEKTTAGKSSSASVVESKEVKPFSRPLRDRVVDSPGIQENITETITTPQQAPVPDQKPEARAEIPSISEPSVGKPQQIQPDQVSEARAAKVENIIPETIRAVPTTKPTVETPAELKTQPTATESQLPQAKEVTDEVGAEEVGRRTPVAEAVKVEDVARFSPSSEEAKRATIPAKPAETKTDRERLTDYSTRLKSIAESKDLNALQALSGEMAAYEDDPRVARLRTAIQDELARARQPRLEASPETGNKITSEKGNLSKSQQKALAQAETPEGKTVRPAPTHRIGAPKPNASRNTLEQQVRAYGGVKDDLSQAYKGELGWLRESAKRGTVNQAGGISVEEMATMLAQDGYGKNVWWEGAPNNVDPQAFLQALMDDARGSTPYFSTERDVIEDDPDVKAWDALVEGAGAELIERVSSGRATAADIVTLTREAQANGLSDRALDAFITSVQRTVKEELSGRTEGTQETQGGYTLSEDGTLLDPDGTPLFSRAFHGSPYDFERFSTEKIGTGEGAQAYGHGLYFTDKREIAQFYKEKLEPGRGNEPHDIAARIYQSLPDLMSETEKTEAVVRELERRKRDSDPTSQNFLFRMDEAIAAVRQGQHKGRVYEVELAPKEDEYLLWDKPLSEQSEKVQKGIRQAFEEIGLPEKGQPFAERNPDGQSTYATIASANMPQERMEREGFPRGWGYAQRGDEGQKAASQYLHSLGIRGIKYLDQGSRSGGEGSYNYVIFSDSDVEIVSQPQFARQLGFINEGFTQEEARSAPTPTQQRERLRREQAEREEDADPARAAALRVLAEIKRRGMSVDEYARQGVLFGTAPSAEEIALLKEVERSSKPAEVSQSRLFAKGREAKPLEFAVEGNRVSLNLQGAEILTDLYQEASQAGQTKGRLRGTFERRGEALSRNLDTLAARGREGAKELATAVRQAARAGNGKVVLFYGESAKKHELFHEASDKANRLMSERHAGLPGLINNDTFRTMSDRLIAMGYPGSNLPLLVEEAAAHIAEGRYDQLGITREQAVEWMYQWFQSFEQANPQVNPREFQEMSDEAAKARDEVYRTAARLEREQSADQTLPSVQERREGRDRESIAAAREPRDITDTEAFRRWFGDSKVVDRQGNPKIVYHASPHSFTVFDPDRILDLGFHFGTAAQAKRIAREKARGSGTTYAVYLSIQRPLRMPDFDSWNPSEVAEWLQQRDILTKGDVGLIADSNNPHKELREYLQAAGYDGVVYRNDVEGRKGEDSYIVFESTQIKSATGNRGTFDPNDPNILMARSGEEYQGEHAPADAGSGAPLHDLTGIYPDDVYGPNGRRFYPTGYDALDDEMYSLIRSYRDHPGRVITIYRAVPKDVKGGINAGDWVTPIRRYAVEHGKDNLGGDYKIQKRLVFARDIYTDGNSWLEWGYDPQPFNAQAEKAARERRKRRAGGEDPLFARSGDPWANLSELSDEFGRLANEPELAPGEKPLSLPKTLEDAGLEAGPARGYLPESIVDDGVERAKQVISDKGIDGAIEFVKTGDGIEWASTGYEVSARLRDEESKLRAEGKADEADSIRDKRITFLDDFAMAAVERGRSIVGIKAISEFAPDRMAYALAKASRKKRKRGISPEEEARITKLGEELGLLAERNKELEKRLAEAASRATARAKKQGQKPKKTDYQSKLEQQASTVLQTLKPKLGKLDLTGLEKKGQSGAAGVPTLMPPLPGDAELIAQYAAAQLAKFNTSAELNQHLVQEFGQDIEQHLPKIRQRAYAIRQQARLAEIEASETEPKRRKTILSEIQKEISESLTAIREAQKAQDRALKAEKAAQVKSERAEARQVLRDAKAAEQVRLDAIADEARTVLAEVEARQKQAEQREIESIREELRTKREAVKDADRKARELRAQDERAYKQSQRETAKAAKQTQDEQRKQEIKEARARLKQQRQEYKQASQAETKGYRETIKAQREAERKAELWDTPLRNAAAEARERLKDATDPKDPQTADDLIAVAAEKFLPAETGGNPRTGAVDPSRVYKDLKDEFPNLVTKKNQGELYKKGYQRIQDATAAAREAARMRSASAESKRLWDELGIDVDAQAVLIQQAEVRRQTDELRRKAQAEFQRVSRTMLEKIWMEAQAIPRSLQSSIDAPIGRQGAYFLLTHPLETIKTAVPATLKGYGSIHVSDYIAREKELAKHPDYKLAVNSGLELTQTSGEGDPALVAEEQHQSAVASRLFPHVRLSEQGYVLGMNAQRLAMFSRLADVGRADGYTPETNPEFFEAVAQFVNDGTGRGTLPDALKRASALLNFFFFSTRLNVSRIQLLNDLFNPLPYLPERFNPARAVPGIGSYDPAMRKVMGKELLRLGLSISTVLLLSAAMGIKVEFDPDDPDGLLLRIRNTRYDITGGEAGTIKFLYRLMKSIYRTANGEELEPFEQPLEIAKRFTRYKLAPLPSGTIDALTGKDAVGQPANLTKFESPKQVIQENVIVRRVLPMLTGNIIDTVSQEGWIGIPMVAPALAGFGVSSYPDRGIRAIKNQAVVDLLESLKITSNSLLGQKTKDEALDRVIQARIMEKVETLDIPQGSTEVGKEKIVKERLAQIRNLARAEAAIAEPKLYADYLKSKEGSESVSVLTDEEKKTLTEQDLTKYRGIYAEAYVEMLKKASQAPNWSKLTDDEKEKVLARIPRIAHNRAKIDLVKTKRPSP